jgi:kynurenine formamidase
MHEVAPDALIRDAVILDLSHKRERQPIEDEDIEAAEERAGLAVRENEIALLMTGWDRHYGTPKYFSNHPALTKSGAEFLEFKGVAAVGVDGPNIDFPDDSTFPAHTTLLSKGILVMENLRGLDAVENSRVRFVALPLPFQARPGSPIRAIIVEN